MTQASIAMNDDTLEGTVASAMPPGFRPATKAPNGRRARSLTIVIALHVLLGWALMSGLARNVIELVKPPLQTKVVVELPPLPEPPPPPPKKVEPVVRENAPTPPPPTFVPQAEVTPPVTAPAITAVAEPPKVEHKIEPPAPPAPAGPVRQDIGIACPKQVAPEMPRKALQDGTSGTVKAQIRVVNGKVEEVAILSGPKVFHAAVRNAMMQYQCSASGEVVASQTFEFNVE